MRVEKPILTVADLMEEFGVSRDHVYEVIIAGRMIDYFRTKINSGPYRFYRESADQYKSIITRKATINGVSR